jgi:2-haloacid dehalogenase
MAFVSASTRRQIKAVLFDTFGTVVDWRSGVARGVAAFADRHRFVDLDAAAFADAWRAKYEPSMDPIRNGTRNFVPLDQLHRENLISTLLQFGLDPSDHGGELDDLTAVWERLDPWQDSVAGLADLGRQVIVGPLSNANLALLLRMALYAGLPWTVIVGSDVTQAYKPTPQAYRNAAHLLRLDPGEVMLAAAHNRDLAAAQRAGLGTAFIPRPSELGPGQTKDLAAEGDWDLVCASIIDLAKRFDGV